MAAHLYSPVRWMQSVHAMLDAGVTAFVEIGPAPVLGPMIDEIRAGWRPQRRAAVADVHWPEFAPPPVAGAHAALAAALHRLYVEPA
ncbi:hypothetical protein ABTH21_19440, partial [Acinetobacter baumannii]